MTENDSTNQQPGNGKSPILETIIAAAAHIWKRLPFVTSYSNNFSDESQWMKTLAIAWDVEPKKIKELWGKARKNQTDKDKNLWPIWVAQGTTAKLNFADTPEGGAIDFEVTSGAGIVIFFEGNKSFARYDLSLDPGKTFYIRLNTDPEKTNQTWRVEIEGKGEGTAVEEGYPCVNQFTLSIADLK